MAVNLSNKAQTISMQPHVDAVELVTRHRDSQAVFGSMTLLLRDDGVNYVKAISIEASCPEGHSFEALLSRGPEMRLRRVYH
jgi:hypothetical protein